MPTRQEVVLKVQRKERTTEMVAYLLELFHYLLAVISLCLIAVELILVTDKSVVVAYGKDAKSAKTKEILAVESMKTKYWTIERITNNNLGPRTLQKSGSLLVAEEEIVEVYSNPESDLDNVNKRKSQRKFISQLLQRYQLPKRKMDSQLWFNLMSVDSTSESLDVCRNILLNDQSAFQLTSPGNANLLCSYEGSRFSLTRVSVRFPRNA